MGRWLVLVLLGAVCCSRVVIVGMFWLFVWACLGCRSFCEGGHGGFVCVVCGEVLCACFI